MDEALLRVTRDGTVTGQANELYDAQMKRVARELDGTATYYVFDGEKIARVEQPEAGTRDFYVQEGQSIYSPLVSVHDEAADAQYWYLFDALGSTMGLVDANGNLSGKLHYDAFGNVLAEENVPRSAFFRYVGAYQYMPEEFENMMLLWHRWYDPTVGRFVGRDRSPQVLLGTRYQYALQRPTGLVDARGHQAEPPAIDGWDVLTELVGGAIEYAMTPEPWLEQLQALWEAIKSGTLALVTWWIDIPWFLPNGMNIKVSMLITCTAAGGETDSICGLARSLPRDNPMWLPTCMEACGVVWGPQDTMALRRCRADCERGILPPRC